MADPYRITDKALGEFAAEMGFRLQGRASSRTIVAGSGGRTLHGPCSNRENMAYLRGVRDVRCGYVPRNHAPVGCNYDHPGTENWCVVHDIWRSEHQTS